MNSFSLKFSALLVFWITLLLTSEAQAQSIGTATPPAAQPSSKDLSMSVQAIQQAPDPSAAVAAYANGIAADRKDPAIHSAYIYRMIDFGLPELAYRQAQALTALDPKNGLAWAVVAHVEARRGNMDDAMSAINQAGMYAPDQKFVQRTAGELIAWYDTRADQTKISDQTKASFARLRDLLSGRTEFANAYDVAKKAYQSDNTAQISQPPTGVGATGPGSTVVTNPPTVGPQGQVQPVPAAGPSAYVEPYSADPQVVYAPPATPPYSYYDDYYYGWGPGWVAPAPAWWWWPNGSFIGFDFFPFSTAFVFHDHDHHHHDGDHSHSHGDWAHHGSGGQFYHGHQVVQSGTPSSRNSAAFFGSHPRPDPAVRSGNISTGQNRLNPSLVSPGPAIPQGNTIGRPGTSSAAPAPPLPVPNSAVRSHGTTSALVPRTSTAAGSSTLVPSSVHNTAASPPRLPLAVPNSAVGQRSTSLSASSSAGAAASSATRVPSVTRSAPATAPNTRPSSAAVWNSPPASTPAAPRTSVSTATPAVRSVPSATMQNPFTASSAARPMARSSPPLSVPNSAVRSAPPVSFPNSGFRSSISVPHSSPMGVSRSAPMSIPHSAPSFGGGGMSHMGGAGRVGGGFSSGGGHGGGGHR